MMAAENTSTLVPHGMIPDMDLSTATMRVESWIMSVVDYILGWFNLGRDSMMASWIYVLVVLLIAIGLGYIIKWVIQLIVSIAASKWHNDVYMRLYRSHFFSKSCRLLPPIMFLIMIQITMNTTHHLAVWLSRFTGIYISIVFALAVSTLIDVIWMHVNEQRNRKKLPLSGLVQLVKGILWLVVLIVDVAILVDKSPASLLAGLGAFAAVLMLVFKDSILGVVAGVQLSENDSLHVGDWIKVEGTDANGIVQEVTLTTVKVQNFDKTITSLPPYSLISGSFTNYRSMQESHTRRIQRSWMVDADTILPLDDALRQEISALPFMADYFKTNDKAETNLGAFRAYLEMYLASNADISQDSTHFVCTLAQTNGGVPLQVYCFTSTSEWIKYEHIQSEVFEHVAIMMAKFHLCTFENASGRDTIVDGYMSNGRIPSGILGIPYPFYMGSDKPENPGEPPQSLSLIHI